MSEGISERKPDTLGDLARMHARVRPDAVAVVGASLGGPYIRVFAGMYPDDVAGLVLVDPTPDTQQSSASRLPTGIPVFLIDAVSPLEVPFATEAIRTLRMNNRPEITADSLEYKRWLDGIPGSRLIVTSRSGHNVPIEQPDLLVATIREAVDEAARRSTRGRSLQID